jgi:hypothetical protein
MSSQAWLLVGLALVVALVLLEGKRQERIYGKSRRRGLMRTGLLELQKQLEPERKVEILVEAKEDDERTESGDSGSDRKGQGGAAATRRDP